MPVILRSLFLACAVLGGLSSAASASVDVTIQADRNRLTLGESFDVQITVRGRLSKPSVMTPQVPACRIERLADPPPRQTAAPQPPAGERRQPTKDAFGSLIGAVEKAQTDALRALADQMSQADPLVLDPSAFELLRQTRQQAMQALQQPRVTGAEFRFAFRITPQRAGVLTLPPFVVQADGRTYQTQPLEITVEPSANTSLPSPPSSGMSQPTSQRSNEAQPEPNVDPAASQTQRSGTWVLTFLGIAIPAAILCGVVLALLWPRRSKTVRPSHTMSAHNPPRTSSLSFEVPVFGRETDPDAIWKCLTDVIRLLCEMPPGEMTAQEAVESLRTANIDFETMRRAERVLFLCEEARFAPASAVNLPEDFADQAGQLYAALLKSKASSRYDARSSPAGQLVSSH
ncbi:MAG: BatD family protein [Gemmatales bacterium]|nr:BatD family protein [Gemmatales bacterium]MDW8385971.1 BatD family protein [Gemmatales bacterium]